MKKTILDSYISRLDIEPESLKAFYSFDSGSGNYIFNNLYTVTGQLLSGIPIGDKYIGVLVGKTKSGFNPSSSGSGIFSYQESVRVGNDVDFSDWTFFINYSASNFANIGSSLGTVLVSTCLNSGLASGFLFGINQANRPFFEYKNGSSSEIHTLNQELGPKNILSLSKIGDVLELTYHDKQHQDNYNLNFKVENFSNSNSWFVGAPFFDSPSYTGVSGVIDDFLLFSSPLQTSTKNFFIDAFFISGITPATTGAAIQYVPSVLEVVINPTGILSTGVTGSGSSIIQVSDITGGLVDIVTFYDLTGYITGAVIEYVTGAPTGVQVSTTIAEQIFFDYGYLNDYIKPLFVYEGVVTPTGQIEVYSYNTLISGINVELELNPIYGTFQAPVPMAADNLNVYLTGLYQISGSGSDNRYSQSSDVIFNTAWPKASRVIADLISGSQEYYSFIGGIGTLVLTDALYSGKDVYLNGKKLVSGIHYTNAGNTYNILETENLMTGLINFAPRRTGIYSMYTGNPSVNFSGVLDEQLWFDGVRLVRGDRYLKTSSQSLRTGNTLTGFSSSIYSNEMSFFDI